MRHKSLAVPEVCVPIFLRTTSKRGTNKFYCPIQFTSHPHSLYRNYETRNLRLKFEYFFFLVSFVLFVVSYPVSQLYLILFVYLYIILLQATSGDPTSLQKHTCIKSMSGIPTLIMLLLRIPFDIFKFKLSGFKVSRL